jgi:hypothetical protein
MNGIKINKAVDLNRSLQTGDIVFKSSKFEGNKLMRVVNAITRIWSRSSYDHAEVIIEFKGNFYTASSEGGKGVRLMLFYKWYESQGFPSLTILRRGEPYTIGETNELISEVKADLGKRYDTFAAITSRLKKDRNEITSEVANKKLFCSEAVSKWTNDKRWQNCWPDQLYDRKIEEGYIIIYKD